MIKLQVIGLDLAKNVFQAHGIDASGQVRLKRRLRRDEVVKPISSLPWNRPLSAWKPVPRLTIGHASCQFLDTRFA